MNEPEYELTLKGLLEGELGMRSRRILDVIELFMLRHKYNAIHLTKDRAFEFINIKRGKK